MNINKYLPNSFQIEQCILGSLIISDYKINEIFNKINQDDFFYKKHKIIFREIFNLYKLKKKIDIILLSEFLTKDNNLEKIGGFLYLAELSKNTINTINVLNYCKIIKEKSISRQIINIFSRIEEILYKKNNINIEKIINILNNKIFYILESNIYEKFPKKVENVINLIINDIKKNKYKNKLIGLSTGFKKLDKKILGLQKTDLIILASRPSIGKTTFAINLCKNILFKKNNKPILIFSLEMSCKQILYKIISSILKINVNNIILGNINEKYLNKILKIKNILKKKNNLYIDDSPNLTIYDIKNRSIKIFKKFNGITLIIIDYIQLIKINDSINNKYIEVTEISRLLKSLAKTLNVPIIAISQLNRNLEFRSNKRPINSDLKESGSLEQDADLIIFIYRENIYKLNNKDKNEYNNKDTAEIIISKNRNGPIGTINFIFNGIYSSFEEN